MAGELPAAGESLATARAAMRAARLGVFQALCLGGEGGTAAMASVEAVQLRSAGWEMLASHAMRRPRRLCLPALATAIEQRLLVHRPTDLQTAFALGREAARVAIALVVAGREGRRLGRRSLESLGG